MNLRRVSSLRQLFGTFVCDSAGGQRAATLRRMAPYSRLALGGLLIFVSCSAFEGSCPCGGRFRDPRGPSTPALASSVRHTLSDHCVCRCGDGEEAYMPPFETECRQFERSCQADDGTASTWQCH